MSLPTLMMRDMIIPHGDQKVNSGTKAIDYIISYIKKSELQTLKKPGDKVFVVKAGTGSGKSSVFVPAMYYKGGRIICTEPTRLVVEQTPFEIMRYNPEFKLGENIGWQTSTSKQIPRKGIIFTTPETINQQIANMKPDEFLKRYKVIFIDEVHKHSLSIDSLLMNIKMLLKKYYKHKNCPIIILMSATLDENLYMDYYDTQHFIEVKGEDNVKIDEIYPDNDIKNLEEYVLDIVKEIKEDTLLFLPKVKMINNFKKLIEEKTDVDAVEVYADTVGNDDYNEIFMKPKKRIILATDAAETGVTFPYLVNVIDSGLVFSVSFNPQYNCTVMSVSAVGKQSATQRRGRAGRVREGRWYPAFTKDIYENKMVKFKHPEIMTSDITVNYMKIINNLTESEIKYDSKKHIHGDISQISRYEIINNGKRFDPLDLDFINKPSNDMVAYAIEKLYVLGFIDSDWNPTMFGVLSSYFRKINIEGIKMILSSIQYDNISIYVIIIAACLSVGTHKLGKFKDTDNKNDTKQLEDYKDDLINYVIIYQKIMDEYHGKTISENKNIEEWFNSRGLNMKRWNNVIELVYELSFSLIKCGYFVNPYLNPKLMNEHIIPIKKCIYEGYRMNLITLHDDEYYTNYKNIKLEKIRSDLVKYPIKDRFGKIRRDVECYLPNFLITTSIIFSENIYTKKMGFNATSISVMDNYVNIDENFFH